MEESRGHGLAQSGRFLGARFASRIPEIQSGPQIYRGLASTARNPEKTVTSTSGPAPCGNRELLRPHAPEQTDKTSEVILRHGHITLAGTRFSACECDTPMLFALFRAVRQRR